MVTSSPQFTCIPLGVEGGLDESNLPAYLLAPFGSSEFICMDAGTLLAGLKVAHRKGCFNDIAIPENSELSFEGNILYRHIKAYLISHPYLDHVEGLAAISPVDCPKPIMSLQGTIEDLKNHLFNWRIWPNFGDAGEPPAQCKYNYITLQAGKSVSIPNISMRVEAFPLAHGNYTDSTAFLVESKGFYALYMGDTGPDEIEKRTTTQTVWKRIATLIKNQQLKGIFIESSYPDDHPDDKLYSHLTPAWLLHSFHQLAALVDPQHPQDALKDFTVIITHIKPALNAGAEVREIVKSQLVAQNDLKLNFVFAKQGRRFDF